MRSGSSTLNQLWNSLGLDSLPADAGTAVGLDSTRMRDWDEATLRSGESSLPPVEQERGDLPRLSLTPPSSTDAREVIHRDLVVTGLLGEGGMGRVLLARQASLGRDVAVKVPRANASSGTISALLHEAQTTGGLEHPGVIPVYSLASDASGHPALVMKRVDGVSWSMLIRHAEDPAWNRIATTGSDRIETHVELLRQVCNAIAFAHRKGVLHRDIKPSNVLIGEFGEVYVADWGIATRKPKKGEKRKPSLVGSPVYMAPEMVTGDDAQMDERTDVFLLGATLYELLTGSPPWSGPDLRSVLEAAWDCRPAPPPASAPEELVAICRRAMAVDPDDRYQTALEFREALGGFLRHRGSVQLARAADERLQTLLATLQSTSHDKVYPLLSECRFGFTQALREWPDNEVARRGLSRCVEATARYEIAQGNLTAARALISELEVVPPELHEALVKLEHSAAEAQRRHARLEHLSQEMDPRVAFRQRVQAFVATTVGILLVVFLPLFFPAAKQALSTLGRWYLSVLMAGVMVFFVLAMWVGRKELLSTRLNRRLMSLVGIAGFGTLLQRIVCALLDFDQRETVMQNFLLVGVVCVTGGFTLHSGFFWSAGAVLAGWLLSLVTPGLEGQVFAVACIGSLGLAALSWRGWRGEFALKRDDFEN
jgi:serine/threonine-protein kinase